MASLQSVATTKNQSKVYTLAPTLESQVMYSQKTIENVVSCRGIGVHSGAPVTVTLYPAISGSGITFVRTDLDEAEILAHWQAVMDTRQCTTIGNSSKATVSTIEHLMAALAANGIDNLRIEINGPELPIMDGSAKPFMSLIDKAGVREQRAARRIIRILKTITVEEGDRKASLSPASAYEIEVDFDFAGRIPLAAQNYVFRPMEEDFAEDIASARTFGLLEDAEKVWAAGLAKGASLENTLVFDGADVLNEEGLRYEDECVRHKILDVLGDLHLAGGLIFGKFHGVRTGHGLHLKLLQALFADTDAYTIESR